MFNKNQEIKNYLKYYLKMKSSPHFAIMLKGRWGSGKTWFIDKFTKEIEEEKIKVLYVSLYGITQTQQIEEEFFRQLHPILSSKTATLAGRILKGIIKGTVKIDLDGDSKADGTATIGLPDINLPEYLKNTSGHILVFDDLERCTLPIADVLGYINYFVEHDGMKVILICNEDVIVGSESKSKDTNDRSYLKIKEKLVGKTFEIEADFHEAIKTFISEIDLDSTRKTIKKHIETIKKIYTNAGYKNLRHLRQAIFDFARMVEILEPILKEKDALIEHLLQFFLIFSFEIKSGTILPEQIEKIEGSLFSSMINQTEETENLYKKLSGKYGDIQITDALLPSPVWRIIFDTGLLNNEEINKILKNSRYFPEENRPDWINLWNMHHLLDNELQTAIEVVDKRLREYEICNIGELSHIISSLMYLSKLGIYDEKNDNIATLGIKNIQKMNENGSLVNEFSSHIISRNKTGYDGLAYHDAASDDFIKFTKKINEIGFKALENNYPTEARQMMDLLKSDTNQFTEELVHDNYKKSRYVQIPILSFMDPTEFVETLKDLPPKSIYKVQHMFSERYSIANYREKLHKEKYWLLRAAEKLEIICQERAGKMSAHTLGDLRARLIAGANFLDRDT